MQSIGEANHLILNRANPMAVVSRRDAQHKVTTLGNLDPNTRHSVQNSIPSREAGCGGLLEFVSLVGGQAGDVRESKERHGFLGDVTEYLLVPDILSADREFWPVCSGDVDCGRVHIKVHWVNRKRPPNVVKEQQEFLPSKVRDILDVGQGLYTRTRQLHSAMIDQMMHEQWVPLRADPCV